MLVSFGCFVAALNIAEIVSNILKIVPSNLTGLFATSGYSGKASGRFFGGFGGDFQVVFGLLPDENSEK